MGERNKGRIAKLPPHCAASLSLPDAIEVEMAVRNSG